PTSDGRSCRLHVFSKVERGRRDASSRCACATGSRRSRCAPTARSSRVNPGFSTMPAPVHVLDHPLIQHKLTLMRRQETSTTNFRRLLNEMGSLMAYEVTRDMPMHEVEIQTPLETMRSTLIDAKKLVFVPILRA